MGREVVGVRCVRISVLAKKLTPARRTEGRGPRVATRRPERMEQRNIAMARGRVQRPVVKAERPLACWR